jgi:ABC-2 type transport system permease protein
MSVTPTLTARIALGAFANHFAFEFKSTLRNPTLLLLHYLFPLGFYVVMGLVMTQINPIFVDTMLPAMVIFAILAGTVLGLPGQLVEAREAGIYRAFKINSVPAASILAIPSIAAIFHALIASLIISVTAAPVFGAVAPVNWVAFGLLTVVTAFTCASFGSLIGVVSGNSRSTVLWSQLLFLPSMLLGGLMVPIDMLPASILPVSGLLPTTYSMQAFMGLAFGEETVWDPTLSLVVLATSGILAFALSIFLFNWDSRNNARRAHPALGLLALLPFVVAVLLLQL